MISKTQKVKKVGGFNQLTNIKKLFCIFFILFFFTKNANSNIVIDYEIEQFLQEITHPILINTDIVRENVVFIILLDSTPNAFVDPLNRIFITTGFVSIAEQPEEIVGVLAHEIGHIESSHVSQRTSILKDSKSILGITNILSLSASLLTNNPDIFIGSSLTSNEIVKSKFSNYSKDQEREADILALKYLEKSHISSEGLKNLLKRMILISERMGIKETELDILTHPYKIERIQLIEKFQKTSKYNNSFFSENIRKKFYYAKAKIDGYTLSLEDNKLKYKNNNSDYKKYALSISYAREGYIKESLDLINEIISFNPNNPFLYETKGEILFNFGYSTEANKFFKKSLKIDKENDYLRIKIINFLFNDLNIKNANQIVNEFDLIKIETAKNNKLLSIMAETHKYLNEEDMMYLYLSMIEINKKNYEKAKDYLYKIENITKDLKIINKVEKLKKSIKYD